MKTTAKERPKIYRWRTHKLRWREEYQAYALTVRGVQLVVFPPKTRDNDSMMYRSHISAPFFSWYTSEPSGKTALDKCAKKFESAVRDCQRRVDHQYKRMGKLCAYLDRLGV